MKDLMKKTKNSIKFGLLLFFMIFIYGCGNAEPVQTTLSIQETQWSELGSTTHDPTVFTPLQRGEVVYDSHDTKITIKSVTNNKVVLEIDGYMIEPNDDGSINLNGEPVKKIELTNSQSIELDSQTMSSGFNLQISYE